MIDTARAMKIIEMMQRGDIDKLRAELVEEMATSREKYGPYRSMHEVWGVLGEEFMEFKQAVHDNNEIAARIEALQIAAVALRFCVEGSNRDKQCQR